jgi:tetratricopeptide (TPR) repeat protein
MDSFTPEFIEKYQRIYESDPHSKVFAPLAEAYRKSGDIQKAYNICKKGVLQHPSFASGHVSMGRIYKDMKEYDKSLHHLRKAVQLAPENIQAHSIMADIFVKSRKPKDALHAFKQVLFLNPKDTKAKNSVKRLESLTADEFDSDTFQMGNLFDFDVLNSDGSVDSSERRPIRLTAAEKERAIERIASLIDVLLVRNELEKAQSTLEEALKKYGSHKELTYRQDMIGNHRERLSQENSIYQASPLNLQKNEAPAATAAVLLKKKISHLTILLHRFEAQKSVPFRFS